MKILNLYSGIGGNRRLWGDDHEVTAIEYSDEIANVYQEFFPKDEVIVTDAHEYLLKNYQDYDFIWSSPPCPSHSRMRYTCTKSEQKTRSKLPVVYPDMTLYQEIILLEKYHTGLWVVENVIPYYQPLIPGKKIGRHLIWSNFNIPSFNKKTKSIRGNSIKELQDDRGFDLSPFKLNFRKDTILLNCVDSELALHIFDCALNKPISEDGDQGVLF
jgi:DNA (cytosine-5)-methyltransferase 1